MSAESMSSLKNHGHEMSSSHSNSTEGVDFLTLEKRKRNLEESSSPSDEHSDKSMCSLKNHGHDMSSSHSNLTVANNCVDALPPKKRKRNREESSSPSDEHRNKQTSVYGNVDDFDSSIYGPVTKKIVLDNSSTEHNIAAYLFPSRYITKSSEGGKDQMSDHATTSESFIKGVQPLLTSESVIEDVPPLNTQMSDPVTISESVTKDVQPLLTEQEVYKKFPWLFDDVRHQNYSWFCKNTPEDSDQTSDLVKTSQSASGYKSFQSSTRKSQYSLNHSDQMSDSVTTSKDPPLSCHFRKAIDPVNEIKPERKVGVVYSSNTLQRKTQILNRPVYTQMNSRDVSSVIRNYLYLWAHLRQGNAVKIRDFIISRVFRIHQEHANLFLNLHCHAIVDEIKGINYRYFLDLIVKSVVDYQDGKLVMRRYQPGNQCIWNKKILSVC